MQEDYRFMENFKRIKDYAVTAIKRQGELVELLKNAKDKLQKMDYSFEKQFENYNISYKLSMLKKDKLEPSTYVYKSIKYWLNENNDFSYKKKFGKEYDGEYRFALNTKRIAENLLDKKLVKRSLYTNIVASERTSDVFDNDYLYKYYYYYYYPVKVDIYCDKDFDTTKKYSLDQIQKLIETKQIVLDSYFMYDDNNKEETSYVENNKDEKGNFNIKRLKYTSNDKVEFCEKSNSKIYENEKTNKMQNFVYLKDETKYNYFEDSKNYKKFTSIYPDFLKAVEDEILTKLNEDILKQKRVAVFIKNYYNEYLNRMIKKYQDELDTQKKALENIGKDSSLNL